MEKEDSECYRRQGFETPHRKEQQFEEAVARSGNTSTSRDCKSCRTDSVSQ